jgi:uncharacterized protein with PIN domain
MRTLVEPAPWSRCEHCRGELRLKVIETENRTLDLELEIFVCVSCGRERWLAVDHDRHAPHSNLA